VKNIILKINQSYHFIIDNNFMMRMFFCIMNSYLIQMIKLKKKIVYAEKRMYLLLLLLLLLLYIYMRFLFSI